LLTKIHSKWTIEARRGFQQYNAMMKLKDWNKGKLFKGV
jgi:hypothetical protein